MGQRSWCLSKVVAVGLLALATGILSCGKAEAPAEGQDQEEAEAPGGAEGLAKGWTAQKREVMVGTPEGEELREITYYKNAIGMEFVLVSAGEFLMGSPAGEANRDDDETQHRVRITKPFYMGVTEVTQEQWKAVMGSSPWSGEVYPGRSNDAPVTYVSWNDAQEFCKKVGARHAVPAGMTVRLPTEAEWEYACRAGSRTAYCFGDNAAQLGDYAWYDDNAGDAGEKYPHSVGKKKPNAWGLYDMHGNVWEWCQDWYGSYPTAAADDPSGPANGELRVLRGGSWYYDPLNCRSASRSRFGRSLAFPDIGFRVAVSPRP